MMNEIENHEPRIITIIRNGEKLINEGHQDSDEFERLNNELKKKWDELKNAVDQRKEKLIQSERAQQYLFDGKNNDVAVFIYYIRLSNLNMIKTKLKAIHTLCSLICKNTNVFSFFVLASEAEAWMSEQELYMMAEDRGKDEISAQNLIKKHEALENDIDDYADTIRQLGETARQLILQEHPESDNIGLKQAQVDKLYAGLKVSNLPATQSRPQYDTDLFYPYFC